MIKNARKTKYALVVCLLAFGCMLIYPSLLKAQNLTHTVEKGDTLWSICEKYYGDPDLWPKLWQMNPFITNPHFLHPGDLITLLEQEPLKTDSAPEEAEKIVTETAEPEMTGINVSAITTIGAIGFLSPDKVQPWGHVFSSMISSKLLLGDGDRIVVKFEKDRRPKPGDKFTVGQSSSLLRHPITEKKLGYTFEVHGYLVLKKHLKLNHYEAEILDAFRAINVDDLVIPYEPVSPCVQPLSAGKETVTNIVASREQRDIIAQHSVVYLDQGLDQGIRRGHLFEIINLKKINDPDFKGENFKEIVKELSKTSSLEEIYKKYTHETTLYEWPLGAMIIVESRARTSTAVVLSTKENFYNGAFVKSLSWEEPPDVVSKMKRCTVE